MGVTVLVPSSEFITLGAASYAILRYDSDFPSLPDIDEVRKSSALWRILSETLGHTSHRVNVQSFFTEGWTVPLQLLWMCNDQFHLH